MTSLKQIKKVRFVDEVKVENIDYDEKQEDISCDTESAASEGDIGTSIQTGDFADSDDINTCHPIDENSIASEINNECIEYADSESECKNIESQNRVVTDKSGDSEYTDDSQETSKDTCKNSDAKCINDGETVSNLERGNKDLIRESTFCNETVDECNPAEDSGSALVFFEEEDAVTCFQFEGEGSCIEDGELLNHEDLSLSKSLCERPKQCLPIKKQSLELNSLLKQYTFDIDSAEKLKSAVFKAWCQLKKGEVNARKSSLKEDKVIMESHTEKTAHLNPHTERGAKKPKSKKVHFKKSKSVAAPVIERGKSKNDKEENEMAFKLWVKQKNEMLKQKKIKKYQKEQEEKVDSIMNEELKKQEAETAYLAWKIQKYESNKKEKKMKDWILQHEEKRKVKRSEEALEMYYMWLQNKHSRKSISHKTEEEKPPWIPPGRS